MSVDRAVDMPTKLPVIHCQLSRVKYPRSCEHKPLLLDHLTLKLPPAPLV
jgi:hypothetical protein